MRILVLTNLYPRPFRETLAPFNRAQFHALVPEHELRIVAPVAWTEELRDRLRGRVTTSRRQTADGVTVEHPLYFFLPKIAPHHYGPCFLWSVRRTIRRVIREFHPEIILAAWAHPDGWAATKLAEEANLPCVIKVHGSDVLINAKSGRRRLEIAKALQSADCVLTVSRDLKRRVIDLGVTSAKVKVLLEGLDGEKFNPGNKIDARIRLGLPTETRQILFVGNLLLSKGLGILVEACQVLKDRRELFECRIVGRGRQEGEIRKRICAAGLDQYVFLAGSRPHQELPDWYRASDMLVLPSFSEGIPNVLRESVACGCPFVSTTVGGIPEIAQPDASILVEPGDPLALANALQTMLKYPPSVEQVVATHQHVSWEQAAEQLTEIFRSITPHNATAEVAKS